jgi:hypothetical protein
MRTFIKDPDADLDYGMDWTNWLNGDTIVASTWIAPDGSGLALHDGATNAAGTVTTIWLRGGVVAATPWMVTNRITTAGGRTEDRSLLITVRER